MLQTKSEDVVQLARGRRQNLVSEFWNFLKHNKKWWLFPIVLVFLVLGALIVLSGSAGGPFIYTLF